MTTLPSEDIMRVAIATRDKGFDGKFFYGVITTGVFCRPSCAARPARPENLRFFSSPERALEAGFRPCKRCRPSESEPAMVDIARYIEHNAEHSLTLAHLAQKAGLSSTYLQRAFKRAFGISPKAFHDAVRMRRFKSSLKRGDDVTTAIYDAGYSSDSRVYGENLRNIGMTPSAYRRNGEGELITYLCCNTMLGPMMMAATSRGVCFVEFGESEESLLESLRYEFSKARLEPSSDKKNPQLNMWITALDAHISRGTPRPDLPLDLRGTAFQIKVWRFLLSVQEGDVISYSELASGIKKKDAVRAAASACGANKIAVLVPCHRVLRGDGSLGGYRWGLARKRTLLDAERQHGAGKQK